MNTRVLICGVILLGGACGLVPDTTHLTYPPIDAVSRHTIQKAKCLDRQRKNMSKRRVCLLQDVHVPRLITPAEKGRDLEPRVIDAYIIQCQAEAQEGEDAPSPS